MDCWQLLTGVLQRSSFEYSVKLSNVPRQTTVAKLFCNYVTGQQSTVSPIKDSSTGDFPENFLKHPRIAMIDL